MDEAAGTTTADAPRGTPGVVVTVPWGIAASITVVVPVSPIKSH